MNIQKIAARLGLLAGKTDFQSLISEVEFVVLRFDGLEIPAHISKSVVQAMAQENTGSENTAMDYRRIQEVTQIPSDLIVLCCHALERAGIISISVKERQLYYTLCLTKLMEMRKHG